MPKITWSDLRAFRNNRLLKTSYFWLIFTPISARILEKIESPLVIFNGENSIIIVLDLPFSWKLFYFAAIFCTLAMIVYEIRCPELIKKFRSYPEFKDSGRGSDQLTKYFSDFSRSDVKSIGVNNITKFVSEFGQRHTRGSRIPISFGAEEAINSLEISLEQIEKCEISANSTDQAFWIIYNFMDETRSISRYGCAAIFCISFSLFTFVIIQNSIYVVNRWLL